VKIMRSRASIRSNRSIFIAFVLSLHAASAAAQPVIGSEFQVNTYTNGNQQRAAVASTPAGAFVIAWASNGSNDFDNSYYSIQVRRYDSSGAPTADQFQANTYGFGWQTYPAVATDPVGNFVVVWENGTNSGSTAGDSIQGQRYDSTGTPIGTEFQLNETTTTSEARPAVAVDPNGNFVAVWTSGTFGPGAEGASVHGRRFNSSGAPIGGEFQVNTLTANNQWFPAVAYLPGGGFAVVFGSFASAGGDADGQSVQARFYDANGIALGPEVQVNTYVTSSQTFPEISVNANGGFVITWHSTGSSTDPNHSDVVARRFLTIGIPLGPDFQVNTHTLGHQNFPEVAAEPSGGFVVVWEDSILGVQARRYDANGTPLSDDFPASESMNTVRPHVAMDGVGRFVVAGEVFPGGYGGSEIFGLRFASPPGPIPVKIAVIKPDKLFKFVAKGTFTLPDPASDDPTIEGGELLFSSTSGGQNYLLPPACWTPIGPGGSKGFKCKDTTCKVIVKEKTIKGVCKMDTGDYGPLPDSEPVDIVLTIGSSTQYCGLCGGTPKGNPDTIFKRKDCPAPAVCP
jgi:hypothetical protein